MQKCMVAKVPFLLLFLNCDLTMFYNDISKMVWILMHHHFSTKLMLITARSSVTTQRLRSFKFILISKSHSQHSEAAVHCIRHHFLILYACIYIVLFPDQSTRQLVWEQGWLVHSQVKSQVDQHWQQAVRMGGMVFSRDSGMNTMYVGKVLHSAG